MKIFISHSEKDKDVAKKFKDLFVDFGKKRRPTEVFLSSDITSNQRKSSQWKLNVEMNLKDCSLFVVLVTPNSLKSRWVQYEIGYALALGINVLPIGIRGVSPEDFLLNDISMQIVKEKKDISELFSFIFDLPEESYDEWYEKNKETINRLIVLCKERCVYFVGSRPKNKENWKENLINEFLKKVTNGLLDGGIRVSSFPSVDEVGKIVCQTAMASHPELYEISGLYKFDKIPKYEKGKTIDENTWKNTLAGYRRLYLANKSSIIIIGGNDHTEDEYKVAESFDHMEIFPIPCMGGFGEKLFLEYRKNEKKLRQFNHPCFNCEDYKNKECCERIKEFVGRLGKYNYIDEGDERES